MGAERTENASGEYGGMEGDLRNLKNSKYPDSPPEGFMGAERTENASDGYGGMEGDLRNFK